MSIDREWLLRVGNFIILVCREITSVGIWRNHEKIKTTMKETHQTYTAGLVKHCL